MRARLPILFASLACACTPGPRTLRATPPVTLFPSPLYAAQAAIALPVATACVTSDGLSAHATLDARAPDLVRAAGLAPTAPGASCDYTIAFTSSLPSLPAAAQAAWDATANLAGAGERYAVVAAARDTPAAASAELYAESERGALHALTAALSLVDGERRVRAATIVDAPAIAMRGVVEGYYGQPFSRDQRDCVITTMERLRQNLYLYGPKDDPYARLRWFDPYPPAAADDLRAAAATARAHLVDFVWSVSPGQGQDPTVAADTSLSFSSDADFARLTAKIDGVRALGIDRFALFLDDTTEGLSHAADLAKYGSAVAAHADLANRLDDYVTGGDPAAPHLLFVGYAYTTATPGWDVYTEELGARLHPGIGVLWTGSNTYADTMKAADLLAPDNLLARKVVIWDNEPVGLTPLSGRSADLPDGISGYLANPVVIQLGWGFDDWWSILGTVGDYAWGPAGYDGTRSFRAWHTLGATRPGC